MFDWARARGLDAVIGPKGMSPFDGYGLLDLLRELRVTNGLSGNGAGILPEFQGLGGNALLYAAMEQTLRDFHFEWYELTQVAETAVQMRLDLATLGGQPYKNHRVYRKTL